MNRRYIYLLLVSSGVVCYVLSLFSPLLSISEFYIFSETLTIYSVMQSLYWGGEWLLFLAIFIFALLLPSAKYTLLLLYGIYLNSYKPSNKIITVLEAVSKWAMLDVFIVAILIAGIKLKALSSAQTHYGLYLFVVSVLIAIASTYFYKYVQAKTYEE